MFITLRKYLFYIFIVLTSFNLTFLLPNLNLVVIVPEVNQMFPQL